MLPPKDDTPTLADLGISKRESAEPVAASVLGVQERRGGGVLGRPNTKTGADRGRRARIFCTVAPA